MSAEQPPPLCHCQKPMKLVRTIADLGEVPEIFVFYCTHCKHAETKVQGQVV